MIKRFGLVLALLSLLAACAESTGVSGATTTVGGQLVSGYVHAGPTCPVQYDPPEPACADRPVEGAVIRILDPSGVQVGEATSTADGAFSVLLPPGGYTLSPEPVEGLMGTASEQEIVVGDSPVDDIDLSYDTGIR